jgi:hypothetical protein
MGRRRDGHVRPNWGPETFVIEGELGPGPFDFRDIPRQGFGSFPSCGLYEVVSRGADFDLDAVVLGVAWSDFDECTFRQRIRRPIDGLWPQGSLALKPTIYRRCMFEGVRFRIRAGFSVGHARFEECIFRRCRFEEHFSFCADYVRCRFEGTIRTALFYGRAPDGVGCNGKVNEIVGNDFTHAVLGENVGWRGNVDLSAQTWPEGYTPAEVLP